MHSTSFTRVLPSLAILAVLSSCDSPRTPVELEGSLAPSAQALPAAAASRSATGSGHFTSGGELRTFAFGAVGRADGSASGQYEIVIHSVDRYLHVDVTCMSVVGNKAWVAGIITKTNHPAIVEGTVSYFWTVDGGEGADAVDIVSLARINDRPGEDRRFCSLMPDEQFSGLPGRVVEKGNVQVRGE